LDSPDLEQAEFDGYDYVHDTYPEAINVDITNIKEI